MFKTDLPLESIFGLYTKDGGKRLYTKDGGKPLHACRNIPHGNLPVIDGAIGKINIHRKAWQIPQQKVERRPSFKSHKGSTAFRVVVFNQGQNPQ